ncbi:MAG: hypothetical protein U1B80_02795, partial [Anaerolineaceae bacterium]|nr:hypothetical protein [Anaerolineaceae bacterium]
QGTVTGSEAARVCHAALAAAELQPELVGLIETASLTDSTIHPAEAQGLAAAYVANGELTCALSAGEGGLLGLIKTAWRLKQRVITGMPQWAGLEQSAQWQQSPFYVPTESRTWFLPAGHNRRYAAFNTLSDAGGFAQFILRDEASIATHPNGALRHETLELFPIVGETVSQLIELMANLQSRAAAGANLAAEAQRAYAQYLVEQPSPNHTACLLSRTPEELQREIGFAVKGIPAAFDKKSDWQTPLGSYFTSQPLGGNGDVAFVYPGAFNSYPGVGRDLFYLFPNLYDRLTTVSSQVGELLNEKLLYPRSLTPLSQSDLETYEKQLNADPLAMLISGSSLAVIYTLLLRETFDIHPAHAFGYSLGEISMMFATSVWTNG